MALVTYPLNNVNYTAEDAELFHSTRTSGIYASNSFDYSVSGADNTIVIGPGIGWIKNGLFSGKVVAQKNNFQLNLGISDPVYARIDAIVIRFDSSANETNIVVKSGTSASSPVPPAVVRTESVYELHLYHVRREPGSLYVTEKDVTDVRINDAYCGLMADSVTKIDTKAISEQVNQLIEDLGHKIEMVEDNSAWLLRTGGRMEGQIEMGGNKITEVGTPEDPHDAVPKTYVDKKMGIRKVWENENPNVAFPAQKVELNLSDALGVSIFYKNESTGSYFLNTGYIPKGYMSAMWFVSQNGNRTQRSFTSTDSGVEFENGLLSGSSGARNIMDIPVEIYAWYGMTETEDPIEIAAICGTFICGEANCGQ